MERVGSHLLHYLMMVAVAWSFFGAGSALADVLRLDGSTQTLSATLADSDLPSLIETLAAENDIKVSGSEFLANEKISLMFQDLPVEQGLKRILQSVNYLALFDQQGNISRLIIISKKPHVGKQPAVATKKSTPRTTRRSAAARRRPARLPK